MRIAFLGTGDFGCPSLRRLRQSGHTVCAAISQPDRPAGRGLEVKPTAIHLQAEALGIPHFQTADVNALSAAEILRDAEIGVVAAFGQKIGPALLKALPRGMVNLHGSLLPAYRGAAPFQWAILNGDTTTGVTLFQLDERWDNGPIWATREIAIGPTETADELHDRLALLAADLIVDALDGIAAGTLQPIPQDASKASRAPKLTRADGRIDWSEPAEFLVRRINGLWSWPATTCVFESAGGKQERVQLARAGLCDATALPTETLAPGAILADGSVQTGGGRLRVLELKPAGGKLLSFDAFARGRDVRPPARFLRLEAL